MSENNVFYNDYFLMQDKLTRQLEIFLQNMKDGKEPTFTMREVSLLDDIFQRKEEVIHRIAVLDGIYNQRYQQTSLFDNDELEKKRNESLKKISTEIRIREFEDQLSLFQILDPKDRDLSHTIEVLIGAPRFERGRETTKPKNTNDDLIITKTYGDRGEKNVVITRPTIMKTERKVEGVVIEEEKYFYPDTNVELIEDILIKIATRGDAEIKNDDKGNAVIGVLFTIKQIRKELKAIGKTRSHSQIMHSLKLGTMSVQEIIIPTSEGRRVNIISPIFKNFIHVDRESFQNKNAGDRKCYIELHPLVIPCIQSQTYRKFNYVSAMKYKRPMAGWFYKRLSHYYVQAGHEMPYGILLTTIMALYGVKIYENISENHREFAAALKEMIEKGDIKNYDYDLIKDPADKRITTDYKYQVWVTDHFIREMIKFNVDYEQKNPDKMRRIPDRFLNDITFKK